MRKIINTSFVYSILAFVAGVFYREFTKFNGFTGKTTLGVVHTHLFVLGVFFFLLLALFIKSYPDILENKKFSIFYIWYNISLCLFSVMLLVRGVVQVLNVSLSTPINASISGMAGISHIMLTVSIIYFFNILKKIIK
ncbi:DUF2871 domain-containing protein [Anaerofustis sp.]|uniref:DUF2871 domain-containing protein n=1 Tax=Anaerofustis sp. TaxID=1872517 RepID=UPI0025BBFDCF|nr:DUF2871 domain-containing protein [Anaerofustis sp.]